MAIDINVWLKDKVSIYVGGRPEKGQQPLLTISIDSPQIIVDKERNIVYIVETK